ncbi:PLP-dependent aminotransferase family protein [Polyangium aurulentum]|uniref:MocR-like pyridoxine biosynthesis transcription factor PdxR n=1 Tax=Polyangium aurulentum TaxID=2567896 RepID=UPI0010AE7172|nr:PLP-dependent aminotransferase family protein [Polyangium aurulentum]UQA63085.1 PLP-dependent aminotransferase family protein [Polyangium aurulentum]
MVPAPRVLPPVILLERDAPTPLTAQLVEQLRRAVLEGVLPPGHKLPSSRELARDLGISRNTAAAAYEALAAEGTIVVRPRRAPVVGDVPARRTPAASRPAIAIAPHLSRSARRVASIVPADRLDDLLGQRARSRPFGVGLPDLELFAWRVFERCLVRRFRAMTTADALHDDPRGLPALRRAVLSHVAVARGVRATVDQVFITEGYQGAIDLVCRALLDAGDEAWMEDPGPLALRAAVRMAGARPIPIPVDEDGLRVRVGVRRSPRARVAFVSPAYAFPTGARLDLARRIELLAWANEAGAMIVEIDYEGELRYQGAPLPSLLSLDGEGAKDRVLHIGTFSRALFPGLRLGFLVVPEALVRPVASIRAASTRSPPYLTQAALADFIDGGHFSRHLRAVRQATRRRRDLLVAELERRLPGSFRVHVPGAGPVLTVELPAGMDDVALVQRLARRGVDAIALSRLTAGRRKSSGLVLGFGAHPEAALQRAARALAEAVLGRRASSD